MPNAKVLSEKQAIVEALAKRIGNASSGVLVDYKGINVAEDTALRRELRAAGIEYTVVKNTLLRFAVDKCNFNEFDSLLNGTTSLATTEGDPIAPIRIVSENAKKLNGKFEIKGGFMEGKVLSLDELNEIAYRNDESIRSVVGDSDCVSVDENVADAVEKVLHMDRAGYAHACQSAGALVEQYAFETLTKRMLDVFMAAEKAD